MSQLQVVHFTVVGKGFFPSDMLRYDSCYPQTPRDVDPIFVHEWEDEKHTRAVNLSTRVHGAKRTVDGLITKGLLPTIERWRSFGWVVKDVKIWTSS